VTASCRLELAVWKVDGCAFTLFCRVMNYLATSVELVPSDSQAKNKTFDHCDRVDAVSHRR
jgi:hypothetical protein